MWSDIKKEFEEKKCTLITEEYVGASVKLEFLCNRHPNRGVQKSTYSNFKKGLGCRYCGFEITSSKQVRNCFSKVKDAFEAKGLTLLDQEYKHAHQLLKYICNKHVEQGTQVMSYSNVKNNGCPKCRQSKGERAIASWLNENNIPFISQKKFDGLVSSLGNHLLFDFYLPEHNCLIEYQGEFHDGTSSLQKPQDYQKQKIHDGLKKQYAKDSGIKLIEIWYHEKKNIKKILQENIA